MRQMKVFCETMYFVHSNTLVKTDKRLAIFFMILHRFCCMYLYLGVNNAS